MSVDPWTEERVAMLKTLWADGATARAIAAQLGGLTRSAVLGKVYRLRHGALARPLVPAQAAKAAGPMPPALPSETAAASARPANPTRRRGRGKRNGAIAALPVAGSRRGKSLLELTNECCRWPHGRPGTAAFFYCGAPGANLEAGMPYCARHARRAYVTRPRLMEIADLLAAAPPDETLARSPSASPGYVWRSPVRHPAARWR
jgi:GcrA cell cycle regulator